MSATMLVAVASVFVMVAVLSASATSWVLARQSPEHKRLRNLGKAPKAKLVIEQPRLSDAPDRTTALISRVLPRNRKEIKRLQARLARAGFPDSRAVGYYSLAQVVMPIVCGVTGLILGGQSRGWVFALIGVALGVYLPELYIGQKTKQRQKAIQNGLPDALDLLTICVEAGTGLDAAMSKASDELEIAHPVLAEEMRVVTTEVRAGKPRIDAFKNFATRTGVEDVRTLVAMLLQTDRFGTSVGQALRTHAETSRTKRRQRAEERAAKVSVKLVFPLALCLFPALYVVCFGPVIVRVYRAFFQAGF
jgi:tight adherence protein C